MTFFKSYSSITNFLYRFTILKIGKLHIRLHKIIDCDKSTLYHTHPFHYISIILKGGYTERYISGNEVKEKSHSFGSIIFRKNSVFHRIETLKSNNTITLFITYGNYGWKAHNTENNTKDDGIFQRIINNKEVWSKKKNGIWFIGNINKNIAFKETRHSIHQLIDVNNKE